MTDGRTDVQTDGRTEISSQYRVCIKYSAVKRSGEFSEFGIGMYSSFRLLGALTAKIGLEDRGVIGSFVRRFTVQRTELSVIEGGRNGWKCTK